MVDWLLIVAVVIGLLLPVAVALLTVYLGTPRTGAHTWSMALAFGKGIGLGALGGAVVSGVCISLVLALNRALGR